MKMIKYEDNSQEILYEQIQPDLKTSVKIVEIKLKGDEIDCQVPKHWHRSIEIIIPRIGSTEAWIEGKIHHVFPNDFLIINSKEIHSCRNVYPHTPYLGYAIQIKYDFIKSCFKEINHYSFKTSYHGEKHDYLNYLLNEIIDLFSSENQFKHIKLQSHILDLVYCLLSYCSYQKTNEYTIQSSKQKNKLVDILSYIDENSDDYIDVNDLAKNFHLSYGYIANLFKTYLNISINEYINYVRIKKIEKDLIISDDSIMDICLSHGFTNMKSFYREFNKYHDQTPKEYRKTALNQNRKVEK